jgi:hypothetical protein
MVQDISQITVFDAARPNSVKVRQREQRSELRPSCATVPPIDGKYPNAAANIPKILNAIPPMAD